MQERPEFPKQSTPGDRHRTTIQGRTYDVYRLIQETRTLPIVNVSVSDLFSEIVDNSYWNDVQGKSITIREVCEALIRNNGNIDWPSTLRAHPNLAEHIRKVRDADYAYPILLVLGHGIVDGIHRLTKAHIDGARTVPTRQLETVPETALYHEDTE
jgi:hypothetical protein